MGRDAILLCREYLRASSPETRRKAAAALEASAGETGAGAELVRLALRDDDDGVRRRAEAAISRLPEEPRRHALAALHAALGDPESKLRAYGLLTRLANQGIAASHARRPLTHRLRLASAARAAEEADRASYQGAFQWSLGFALLGTVVLSFLIAVKTSASLVLIAYVAAAALVLAVGLAHAAGKATLPGDRYLDRGAGWFVEICESGVASLPAFSVVGVVMLPLWPSLGDNTGLTVASLGLGVLAYGWLFIAAIRAATLSCSVLLKHSNWSTLLGAGAGWGAGMAVATAALYLVRALARWRADEDVATLAAGFWLLALPVAAGVAAAFARLERGVEPPRRLRWKILMSVPAVLGGVLLLVLWTWLFWPQERPETFRAQIGTPRSWSWSFRRAPALKRFEVGFRQKIRAGVAAQEGTADIVLRLWRDDALIESAHEPPLIDAELARGSYRLEALTSAPGLADKVFDVAQRLAQLEDAAELYALGSRRVDGFDLELTLNADPVFAASARVPELLQAGSLHEAFDSFDLVVKERPELARSVPLLDRLCRTSSLWKLLEIWDLGGPETATVDSRRIVATCDEAVELARDNGAVRDSRALSRMLTGAAKPAVEDLEVFVRWTIEPSEQSRRKRWIKALEDPSRDPRKVPAPADLWALLAKSSDRDVAGWTRSTALAHVARGAELMRDELARLAESPEPGEADPQRLDDAFGAFELAATMVPALRRDAAFWRYVCRRGALLAKARPETIEACDAAVRLEGESAEARESRALARAAIGDVKGAIEDLEASPQAQVGWIEALRQRGALPPESLRELRRKANESWSPPTVPAVDLAAMRSGSTPERPSP